MKKRISKYDMILNLRDTIQEIDANKIPVDGCDTSWAWFEKKINKCMNVCAELSDVDYEHAKLYEELDTSSYKAKFAMIDAVVHAIYDEGLCYRKGYRTPCDIDDDRLREFVQNYLKVDDFLSKKKNEKKLSVEHRGRILPERKEINFDEII